MKKTNKLFGLLAISLVMIWSVSAANIEKINVIDNWHVELSADQNIVFSNQEVKWDVKILKDIPVSFSAKDLENSKKVTVNLWADLNANTSYSLITILWADWNIDFTIWDSLNWEIPNANLLTWDDWIEKINLVDSRTIELYFTKDLTEDTFEFKILSEVKTDSVSSQWDNKLNVTLATPLEKSTSYIVMILNLEDATSNPITFDEDLYDFTTDENLVEVLKVEDNSLAEIQEAQVVEDSTWNIVEIAEQTKTTPETWAETWVLIFLAAVASWAYFFKYKFVKQ